MRTKKKRAAGIEPASSAWKAEVLPLNYARANKKEFPGSWIILIYPTYINTFRPLLLKKIDEFK